MSVQRRRRLPIRERRSRSIKGSGSAFRSAPLAEDAPRGTYKSASGRDIMKTVATRSLLLPVLLLLWGVNNTRAEDIDVFVGGASSASNPRVLIMLDNASAWDAT